MIINDLTGLPAADITPQSAVVTMTHYNRTTLSKVSVGDIVYQTDTVGNSIAGLYLCTGISPAVEWSSFGTWDQNGQVPTNRLPNTVTGDLNYKGLFDATIAMQAVNGTLVANQLANPIGKAGNFFVCNVSSPVSGGIQGYKAGDWAISNGTTYDRLDATVMFDTLPLKVTNPNGTSTTYNIPVYK